MVYLFTIAMIIILVMFHFRWFVAIGLIIIFLLTQYGVI